MDKPLGEITFALRLKLGEYQDRHPVFSLAANQPSFEEEEVD